MTKLAWIEIEEQEGRILALYEYDDDRAAGIICANDLAPEKNVIRLRFFLDGDQISSFSLPNHPALLRAFGNRLLALADQWGKD